MLFNDFCTSSEKATVKIGQERKYISPPPLCTLQLLRVFWKSKARQKRGLWRNQYQDNNQEGSKNSFFTVITNQYIQTVFITEITRNYSRSQIVKLTINHRSCIRLDLVHNKIKARSIIVIHHSLFLASVNGPSNSNGYMQRYMTDDSRDCP